MVCCDTECLAGPYLIISRQFLSYPPSHSFSHTLKQVLRKYNKDTILCYQISFPYFSRVPISWEDRTMLNVVSRNPFYVKKIKYQQVDDLSNWVDGGAVYLDGEDGDGGWRRVHVWDEFAG